MDMFNAPPRSSIKRLGVRAKALRSIGEDLSEASVRQACRILEEDLPFPSAQSVKRSSSSSRSALMEAKACKKTTRRRTQKKTEDIIE